MQEEMQFYNNNDETNDNIKEQQAPLDLSQDEPPKKEISELSDVVHEEIWGKLSDEEKSTVDELAKKTAKDKNVPLGNPFNMEELKNNNLIMLQAFEWYMPESGDFYKRLARFAPKLSQMGVGGVWLPPCFKATGAGDTGYGVYDLYDLGEFDQKGSVRTKYGTKKELLTAIKALQKRHIQVYADVVLNHKAAADETEVFSAVRVDPDDRTKQISEPQDIEGWTKFTFAGRNGKYSDFVWNFNHFTSVDHDQSTGETGIFKILGENKDFSPNVSHERGNYDYLMFADVDCRNKDVIDELLRWGQWFLKETNVDGFRMDALKHIDSNFISVFLRQMRLSANKPMYFVGEYWSNNKEELAEYLNKTNDVTALFDVPLHFNFFTASNEGENYDLRHIFDNSLLALDPINTTTFVDNHDSQPGQSLESFVQPWFKPLAYALILLRQDGYPCLFYGDYFGIAGDYPQEPMQDKLDPLLIARKYCAYGEQEDYFLEKNLIGFVRRGDEHHKNSGLAVLISNGSSGSMTLCMGQNHANKTMFDITGNTKGKIVLDNDGCATFPCPGGSLSVFVFEKVPLPKGFR
ncbi:MAG: alpha-amylase [Eubacteriales bacterium]|nr:alpha-amylase [Eubacteriales bacterium]